MTNSLMYDLGDCAYYRREDSGKWKGPGTVFGKENKQVLVKHGGSYGRVHLWSLQLIPKYNSIKGNSTEINDSCKSKYLSNVCF